MSSSATAKSSKKLTTKQKAAELDEGFTVEDELLGSDSTFTESPPMKPVNKKISWLIAVVFVALLIGWMLSGSFGEPQAPLAEKQRLEKARALPEVQVRRYSLQDYSRTLTLTGETIAARVVVLRSERAALVKKLSVSKGDTIKKGQIVVTLDSGVTSARITQAKSLVSKEELYAESVAKLLAKGLSSKLDQADAVNRLETAKMQLRVAREDYSKSRIVAPFSGQVIRQLVELGDYVAVGAALFELADVSPVKIQSHITEKELAAINNQIPAAGVNLSSGDSYEAVVSYIAPATDAQTKTFSMELDLQSADNLVPLGISASVILRLDAVQAIAISPSLLFLDNSGNPVLKYVDAAGLVQQTTVTIVQSESDATWVTGDQLEQKSFIVTGQGFVFPGDEVISQPSIQGGNRE